MVQEGKKYQQIMQSILLIICAALLSATAINVFVSKANLVPSGVVGLSRLLMLEAKRLFDVEINFSVLYLFINFAMVSFVFKSIGRRFLIYSLMHVVLTSFFVSVLPAIKVTEDVILLSLFGGVVNGLGCSLALKAGGSAGGTDFLVVYFSMVKNRPMWKIVMYFNVSMLVYYGWQYDWTLAFYSIIYQVASTKIIDHYHDRYKLSSLQIITDFDKAEEVSTAILAVVRHGITKLDGRGMYHQKEKSVLYMVVNDFEIPMIVDAVRHVDEKAFIEVASVRSIDGNYRQRPLD